MKSLTFCIVVLVSLNLAGQTKLDGPQGRPGESQEERDARIEWWREARFGMFIHWGIYAELAGFHNGEPIAGRGEWVMHRAEIPVADYKKYAENFNPVKYDPDGWVRMAKDAGMKYIVITAKHHDGFSLFDSRVSDWDIVDATPYGKDLLEPLAEAFRRHQIKFGLYYSQCQDWGHPGGGIRKIPAWDEAQKGDYDQYLREIAVPQVREILTKYGEVAVLWWDTPTDMPEERGKLFDFVTDLQPHIIENNRRQDKFSYGDFSTPEQHIPDIGLDYDFEACMNMNGTWGYRSDFHNWKSSETLIKNLIDLVSKGGNYLLNVGPTAEGEIPEPSVKALEEIGRWMKIYGEAFYGTSASPFDAPEWGRYAKKNGMLYAYVFDWPSNGMLEIKSGDFKVKKAWLLHDKSRVKFKKSADGIIAYLPEKAPNDVASVIVFKWKN